MTILAAFLYATSKVLLMKKFSFRLTGAALKEAMNGFSNDKVTKLSASLAYYTVFSLGPLLLVLIFLCSLLLGREAVEGEVYGQIQGFIGADAAAQVQDIIKNASLSGKGGVAAVIGVITLLIGATSVFGEIQDSINGIWGLKPKPKAGFMKLVRSRLFSFGMIGSLVFLLLVSLAATALVAAAGGRMQAAFPGVAVAVFYFVNLVITLGVTAALFAVIFKVLPDAKIKWLDIWPGAIATSLLFLVGKFAISFYISKSNIGSTYGAAGSLLVVLLWIYYSSFILYFGAEFTKAYALKRGARIVPEEYAEWNREATVAGAQPKTGAPAGTPQPHPQPAVQSPEAVETGFQMHPKKKKRGQPGVGTVLLALTLYLINGDKKKRAEQGS